MERIEMEQNIEQFEKDEHERLFKQSESRESEYIAIAAHIRNYLYGNIDADGLCKELNRRREELAYILCLMQKQEMMGKPANFVMQSLTSAITLFYLSENPEQIGLEAVLSNLEVQAMQAWALERIFQSSVTHLDAE